MSEHLEIAARAQPQGRRERGRASRALLCLCGGWLVLTICMGFLASGNFHVLDPEQLRNADQVYSEIPAGSQRRMDLRYAASELNRYYFHAYSVANLALASAALALLVASRWRSRWMLGSLAVVAVVAVMFLAWLTPLLVDLGRQIDFLPRDPAPPEVARFYRLHQIFVGLELAKLAILAAISVTLVRR